VSGLKVSLISHEFPPFIIGGIATYCFDLAINLSRKGIETKVICGNLNDAESRMKVNRFLEIVRLPFFNFPPRYFWFQLMNHKKLCKLCANCNVIHGVNPTASMLQASYERKSNKALIVTHHLNELQTLKMFVHMPLSELTLGDLMVNAFSYPLDTFLENAWFGYADQIIVPGNFTYDFMKSIYGPELLKKVSVIYNAIDFDKVNSLCKKTANLNDDYPSIISFCRLVSLKGIGRLLLHSKKLFSKFPNLKFKIFGQGPLKSFLEKIIIKQSLHEHVIIMGHVPYNVLLKHIEKASMAVFPTFLEVGPFISALEAMALKKPVVAFDLPFNREFIKPYETGMLAEAGNMDDFIDKISLLLSDQKLRTELGNAAFEYVKKHHNWAYVVDRYIKIYEEFAGSLVS